ncbi:hypothetical protein HMPREF9073_01673 [Capnocytophaga sp. oral taxon 326 str. F0382]|nr:hypothetical protein HMPREF9073_01673 [Capnocytophaga sp. oral taxon 326 str. F0382]
MFCRKASDSWVCAADALTNCAIYFGKLESYNIFGNYMKMMYFCLN